MRACYHKDSDVWSGLPLTSSVEALCLTQGTPPRGRTASGPPAEDCVAGRGGSGAEALRWGGGQRGRQAHAVLFQEREA